MPATDRFDHSLADQANLLRDVANDPAILHFLEFSCTSEVQAAFEARLMAHIPARFHQSINEESLLRNFLAWCGNPRLACPAPIKQAIASRKSRKELHRVQKRDFVTIAGLNWPTIRRDQYLSTIPTFAAAELDEPYPPLGHWVCETGQIWAKWEHHIKKGKQPDSRKRRLPMMELDPKRLAHDVDESESRIFTSKSGRPALIVLRDFCPDDEALAWVDAVVMAAVRARKSVRLEDPGKLVQIGYSAGSRSAPKFDWVKNLLSAKCTDDEVEQMNVDASSACAFVWNLIRCRLPEEIIFDFEDFISAAGLMRMDAQSAMVDSAGKPVYAVNVGDDQFEFHGAELAPPTGIFASNYSRAIHFENQPHKFAISLTSARTRGVEAGGHFYNSKYGIRIQGAANTLVVWVPSEPHGTSLQDFLPKEKDPDFSQRGLAFVTPARLRAVWEKYKQNMIGHSEAWEMLYGNEAQGDEIFG